MDLKRKDSKPSNNLLQKLKDKRKEKNTLPPIIKVHEIDNKVTSIEPHIDFTPLMDEIFISKADLLYVREEEDGYIFRRAELREQKDMEKDKVFDIKVRLRKARQEKLG